MEKQLNEKLNEALRQVEKIYGKGSVYMLGEAKTLDVGAISTGSLLIDECLGIGGLPRGRIIEIYGPEASGKSTLALQCARECQKAGGTVAYIDVENAIDPSYAAKLGVDVDSIAFSQPTSGEEALGIADVFVKSDAFDLVIVDSVAALTPQAELDGEMGDQNIGLLARLMSKAMRKLAGAANQHDCSMIFINQLREKVGVMYGNPEVTTGGRALKFYSSVRIEMRKFGDTIKLGSEPIGNHVRVKISKNKVAVPFKTCEVDNIYGEGFSLDAEIVTMASDKDIIHKAGSWYSYGDEKIGQGGDAVKRWLQENPEKKQEIIDKIRGYNAETGEAIE